MGRKLKSDPVLFGATVGLVCLSIVMVWSASAVVAMERYQQPYLFLTKQLLWATLGLAVLWIGHGHRLPSLPRTAVHLGVRRGRRRVLVAVLFSPPVNNARRWFSIGGLGIQPSELAKLAAIFFMAWMLERRMHRINEVGYALLPIALVVGLLVGLILLEPDFGTVDVARLHRRGHGVRRRSQLPVRGSGRSHAGAARGLHHARRRISAAAIPRVPGSMGRPAGRGFQLIQSLIAVGTGGVTGKGLMQGVQKLFFLPEPHSDFIYAVISEELGLIGATRGPHLLLRDRLAWPDSRVASARTCSARSWHLD